VIYQEYQKLLRAAHMRCFSPSTNLHTYRTYGYLFGMTLVKSYNRAHRVQQAMLLRGFNGKLIPLHRDESNPQDVAFLIVFLLLVVTIAVLPQIV
jgi:cobalt/nickel transport system permease protein